MKNNDRKMTENAEEEIVSISELSKQLGITTRTLRYWGEVTEE